MTELIPPWSSLISAPNNSNISQCTKCRPKEIKWRHVHAVIPTHTPFMERVYMSAYPRARLLKHQGRFNAVWKQIANSEGPNTGQDKKDKGLHRVISPSSRQYKFWSLWPWHSLPRATTTGAKIWDWVYCPRYQSIESVSVASSVCRNGFSRWYLRY